MAYGPRFNFCEQRDLWVRRAGWGFGTEFVFTDLRRFVSLRRRGCLVVEGARGLGYNAGAAICVSWRGVPAWPSS